MIAQLRSELRKMATTRTNLGLLLGVVTLILFGVIAGSFGSEVDLSLVKNQRELIGNGTFAAVFAALIGVTAMTSEFRHGTICPTFVFTPALHLGPRGHQLSIRCQRTSSHIQDRTDAEIRHQYETTPTIRCVHDAAGHLAGDA